MTIPQSASEFFESWVPARLGEVLASGVQLNTRCSVGISVGAETWIISANNGGIGVTPAADTSEPNLVFRISITKPMFERFVLAELANLQAIPAGVPQNSPLLKLFNLDDEALGLIQNIPGSLQLVVYDGDDTSQHATLSPGSQPMTPAACTLKCSLADALALRAGTVAPMELFFAGRIQLEGDPQVAMAIAGLLL